MRSATTFTTPSTFSSRPRTSSAAAPSGHPAVARPAALRAHDVDEPGLVLEVDERHALGRGRALAMRHHPADHHPAPVLAGVQAGGRQRAEPVEDGPHELGGVPVGRHAGGPQVGHRLLLLAHARQPSARRPR